MKTDPMESPKSMSPRQLQHETIELAISGRSVPTDAVAVNATITDSLGGVKLAIINFTNGNGTWVAHNMQNLTQYVWNYVIGPFPYCTNVTYVIIAVDNVNNTITSEELGYDTHYHVIPEFPSFLILPLLMIATLLAAIVLKKRKPTIR